MRPRHGSSGVLAVVLLLGSTLWAGDRLQPALPPSGRAAVERLLQQLPATVGAGQRRVVEELLDFEAPLTPAAIAAAEKLPRSKPGELFALGGPCDPAGLPLDVAYSPDGIGPQGQPLPGQGFTAEERDRFSRFLCRMLPVLRERYGDPFQRWAVTLVKDLRYAGSWIFFPSLLEIHSDGTWNPRLLTHEFLHAFRGQRLLTSDAEWRYVPTLSGFEEGFAEGVAYLAMNDYVRRFCPQGDCTEADVPSQTYWYSYLESSYDFSNDASLTCTDFWSDGGGTLKYYERYLMAASAVMRLETAVPGFGRRFNEEYYARIRKNAGYRPSREAVIGVVETLAPLVDGIPARAWIDRQHIFDSRTLAGKHDWTTNYTPFSALGDPRVAALYFVETFPGGSEWAQYIPDCPRSDGSGFGDYLYHRLSNTPGRVRLTGGGEGIGSPSEVSMQVDPINGRFRTQGCNEIYGGFGAAEIYRVAERAECRPLWSRPVCMVLQSGFGLYGLQTSWRNPQYGLAPGPPAYAMPYDATQRRVATDYPLLAGRMPPDYGRSRHRLAGGVAGSRSGSVTITHSARPGMVRAAYTSGAFFVEPPTCAPPSDDGSCWVHAYASWTTDMVLEPGTLTFTVESDDTGVTFTEQRTVGLSYEGRHEFLLGR